MSRSSREPYSTIVFTHRWDIVSADTLNDIQIIGAIVAVATVVVVVSQKNCAFLFLSELHQISIKFNKFWYAVGKVAGIVCYIYIFHLTRPTSLHYLVKRGCSKFLPNTGFITVRLLRCGVKMKTAYCRDNFLLRSRPLPDMCIVPERVF